MEVLLKVLGVVLVVEGIPWFLSPSRFKKYLRQVISAPDSTLRGIGLMLMLAGLLLVYLAGG